MKRILSVLFAATMIFGMAANASANMGEHDFALMTLNDTRGLETVDTMGPVWVDYQHDPVLPPAGTTITDIFSLSDFAGATSYSEFETIAVSNFEYMSDWSGMIGWMAIQKDATPVFDQNAGSFVTAYTNVKNFHASGDEVKPFAPNQGLKYGGMSTLDILGGFENEKVASVKLDNILTEEILMDIWQLDWTQDSSGDVMNWKKSGFDLKIYNSGGIDLGNEQIDAAIISAVPIPGAVWFLASGLLAVMGIRRRKL